MFLTHVKLPLSSPIGRATKISTLGSASKLRCSRQHDWVTTTQIASLGIASLITAEISACAATGRIEPCRHLCVRMHSSGSAGSCADALGVVFRRRPNSPRIGRKNFPRSPSVTRGLELFVICDKPSRQDGHGFFHLSHINVFCRQ